MIKGKCDVCGGWFPVEAMIVRKCKGGMSAICINCYISAKKSYDGGKKMRWLEVFETDREFIERKIRRMKVIEELKRKYSGAMY